jgi:hypothetical protein
MMTGTTGASVRMERMALASCGMDDPRLAQKTQRKG